MKKSMWFGRCYLRDLKRITKSIFFAGDRRRTNKYHTGSVKTTEKDVSNTHFEIAEGKESGRDLNQPIRGKENLNGKNAKDEILMSKILSL